MFEGNSYCLRISQLELGVNSEVLLHPFLERRLEVLKYLTQACLESFQGTCSQQRLFCYGAVP